MPSGLRIASPCNGLRLQAYPAALSPPAQGQQHTPSLRGGWGESCTSCGKPDGTSGKLNPSVRPATPGVAMLRLSLCVQRAAPRAFSRSLPARHLIALVALLMLPVPMHSGMELPHQDALFALILDASDGIIDHQVAISHETHVHEHHGGAGLEQRGESPAFANALHAQGGGGVIALVVTSVLLLVLPTGAKARIWPKPRPRWGNIPALDPPPPRFAS